MNKLSFSGHESFVCRQFWLKKGYDFIKRNEKFSDDMAVVSLGVGKNMVSSIRHWMKSFGLTGDKDETQDLSEYLFGTSGKDPYLEDLATQWLLHYSLIKTNRASIYNLVFNEFRKERIEFTKPQIDTFIKRRCEETGSNYNANTTKSDISVFLRTYMSPKPGETFSVEDDFSGVLIDLNLIDHSKARDTEDKLIDWYKLSAKERDNLPHQIVLFSILDNEDYGDTISLRELQIGLNSPGLSFALTSEGLYQKIKEICAHYSQITYSETAGNQIIQFKNKPNKWDVLNDYYG
ncbi:MAG: hypothetical protein COW03_11015 [Cytophagales bacterium CG12_big_fil_rev_8_21_14_0_65_40_12]|nr:MAG: hypothetical protein COW03_11015 [Cytophagales bacterium CG12_big_fil_rev_8_21_14_0_65_40_12]PIW05645.1 MAG: DUF4007 domain-containing protein [Cytophagales bacterium CG17_big_fil_post_rev_8_21_14_2_50_40_13]